MTSVADRAARSEVRVQDDVGVYVASFGVSLGITSVFNGVLVLIKELNPSTVLAWMNAAGHHWVTQGVLDLIVFVVLGFALAGAAEQWRYRPNFVLAMALGGVVLGALLIVGFNARELG